MQLAPTDAIYILQWFQTRIDASDSTIRPHEFQLAAALAALGRFPRIQEEYLNCAMDAQNEEDRLYWAKEVDA